MTLKFDRNRSNLCWRNCQQIGDHTHIFWDCPVLKTFWTGIQTEIHSILKVNLPLNPLYYILDLVPDGAMDKKKAHLVSILLLIARKMITICWLKPLPPTIHQWKERLKTVFLMEKITAKLHCRLIPFLTLWAPVINHLNLSSK